MVKTIGNVATRTHSSSVASGGTVTQKHFAGPTLLTMADAPIKPPGPWHDDGNIQHMASESFSRRVVLGSAAMR